MTHHQFSQIVIDGKRSALVADNGDGQLQRQEDNSKADDDLKYPEERAFPLPRHDYIGRARCGSHIHSFANVSFGCIFRL